jgi:hypothetical protein
MLIAFLAAVSLGRADKRETLPLDTQSEETKAARDRPPAFHSPSKIRRPAFAQSPITADSNSNSDAPLSQTSHKKSIPTHNKEDESDSEQRTKRERIVVDTEQRQRKKEDGDSQLKKKKRGEAFNREKEFAEGEKRRLEKEAEIENGEVGQSDSVETESQRKKKRRNAFADERKQEGQEENNIPVLPRKVGRAPKEYDGAVDAEVSGKAKKDTNEEATVVDGEKKRNGTLRREARGVKDSEDGREGKPSGSDRGADSQNGKKENAGGLAAVRRQQKVTPAPGDGSLPVRNPSERNGARSDPSIAAPGNKADNPKEELAGDGTNEGIEEDDSDRASRAKRLFMRNRDRDAVAASSRRQGLTETAGFGIMLGIAAGIGLVAGVFYFGKRPGPVNRDIADANTPLLGVDEFCEL